MPKQYSIYPAAFLVTLVIISAAQSIFCQAPTWSVASTTTGADGNTTVVETASNGARKETWTSYHKGTTNPEIQKSTLINSDGAKIINSKSYAPDGTQKGFSTEAHDSKGYVMFGSRWFIDPTGQRFYEKWDVDRRWWVNAGTDAGPPITSQRRIVRVRYVPSRTADAQTASRLLSDKGFTPALVAIPEGEGHFLGRSLQFFREADSANADVIARTVSGVARVTPNFLGPTSNGQAEPTDRHFEFSLYSKDKPFVRIGYIEARRTNAIHCETALELLGFRVEKVLVEESSVEEKVKGKLFYHRPGDKTTADSIPKCLVDSKDELISTLRRVSAGADAPDFQFVLTSSTGDIHFSHSVETTSREKNAQALTVEDGVNKRLKDVRENWLERLAPGTGVANIVMRDAGDVIRLGYFKIEIRNAVGQLVRPGGSWENNVLPQGTYTVTPFIGRDATSLGPIQFTVTPGTITQVTLGGSKKLSRVIYESADLNGTPMPAYIFITKSDGMWTAAADATGEVYVDLVPGNYVADVKPNQTMRLKTVEFKTEAGMTLRLRPISRGRLAVNVADANRPVAVSTVGNAVVTYLDPFAPNAFVDVPAGDYKNSHRRDLKGGLGQVRRGSVLETMIVPADIDRTCAGRCPIYNNSGGWTYGIAHLLTLRSACPERDFHLLVTN